MRALRNLVVALALVPAIAACSAGGNTLPAVPSAQTAEVNANTENNINPDIMLSETSADDDRQASMAEHPEFREIACQPGLTCTYVKILHPLVVHAALPGYQLIQNSTPTKVTITRSTTMTIATQQMLTTANCHVTCVVVALPATHPPTSIGAGFVEGITQQAGSKVPVVVTHRVLAAGTYYLYLAQQ